MIVKKCRLSKKQKVRSTVTSVAKYITRQQISTVSIPVLDQFAAHKSAPHVADEGSIATLARYIARQRSCDRTPQVYYKACNLHADSLAAQILEMSALATTNPRSKQPCVHYVLSWRAGEHPSHVQTDEAVQIFLAELGLEHCQCLYALHTDTRNDHVHLLVNRVDPVTGLMHRPGHGWDIKAALKAVARIEAVQGWQPEANATSTSPDGSQVHRSRQTARKTAPPIPAHMAARESATGRQSALRQGQHILADILEQASSWQEVHLHLAKQGAAYRLKGAGAIIQWGTTTLKPSSISRKASRKKMEQRLGPYVPPQPGHQVQEVRPTAEPMDMSDELLHQWWIYQCQLKEKRKQYSAQKKYSEENEYKSMFFEFKKLINKIYNIIKEKIEKIFYKEVPHGEKQLFKEALQEVLRERKEAQISAFRALAEPKTRPEPSFADWLLSRHREDLAEQWRCRQHATEDLHMLESGPAPR